MQPLVSIIIPNYNREHLIGETLNSIIAQTYANWECIVVDDGSSDMSEVIIKDFCQIESRIKFIKRPSHLSKGANTCRNYGLELSKGEYINWFDSDDLMHKDKLKLQIQSLVNSEDEYAICQSMEFDTSINNIIGYRCKNLESNNLFNDYITKKKVIPICSLIFRKNFLIENNYLFSEELKAGQEWELFSRIFFDYKSYSIINKPLDYIRRHKSSISGSKGINEKWHYTLARDKIFIRFNNRISENVKIYFYQFFLRRFRELLRANEIKKAFYIWSKYLYKNSFFNLKQRFNMILALLSFKLLKKGAYFIENTKR